MNVISTRNLCKSYAAHRVLHDVDICVESGKLVGFLGPNGAGKTTTIRILLGLLSAESGEADILGMPCRRFGKSLRREIGYLPGDVHFYSNMTARAILQFLARARQRDCREEIERLAIAFDLVLDKIVRKFSTGMRQKLGLIQALMHKPRLLILDEPTSGLDPLMKIKVFEELKRANTEGRTVLFSSHSLDEVEELCDEVIILRGGRIVESQKIDVLRGRALRRVSIEFRADSNIPSSFPENLQAIEQSNYLLRGTWSGDINFLLEWIKSHQVADLMIERPDLNDLFMTYYSESLEALKD